MTKTHNCLELECSDQHNALCTSKWQVSTPDPNCLELEPKPEPEPKLSPELKPTVAGVWGAPKRSWLAAQCGSKTSAGSGAAGPSYLTRVD